MYLPLYIFLGTSQDAAHSLAASNTLTRRPPALRAPWQFRKVDTLLQRGRYTLAELLSSQNLESKFGIEQL